MLILIIFLMYGLFTMLTPMLRNGSSFVNYNRILSAFNYAYFIGFLGLGVTFVIATGGIDFSIGRGDVLLGADLRLLPDEVQHAAVAVPVCQRVRGRGVSARSAGTLWRFAILPSFITSLALMQVAKGVGSIFTKTQSVTWPSNDRGNSWYRDLVKWNGFPVGLCDFLIVIAALCAVLFYRTKAGRYMLCLGSNKEAVRLSGVDTRRWEMLAYVMSGTLAGVAAIFYVGAYTTVQPGLGDTFNNEAIAACVMGGTSMAGGSASILGTVIGAIIVALMQEGILAMGFTISYQYVLTGLIVLGAVTADIISRKRKN